MMADYFDNDQLIVEVKCRPALYDKNVTEYMNKNVRDRLWKEVCEVVIPEWATLDRAERNEKEKDIQKKWKNMRDSFKKQLNLQLETPSSRRGKRKRNYIYFEQLRFLLPFSQDRRRPVNYSPPQAFGGEDLTEDQDETTSHTPEIENTEMPRPRKSVTVSEVYSMSAFDTTNHKASLSEESHPKTSNAVAIRPEDTHEDKTFLLSLLPYFEKFSPQQRLVAKMEVLQAIQRTIFQQNNQDTAVRPHQLNHQNQMNNNFFLDSLSANEHEVIKIEPSIPNDGDESLGEARESQSPIPVATSLSRSSNHPQSKKQRLAVVSSTHHQLQRSCSCLEHSSGETFEEHFPIVAKIWGEKLNKLEPLQKDFAEKAVNDVLFEANQGTLHRHSVKINEDQRYEVLLP